MNSFDLILLVAVFVILVVDIFLAVCLRLVIPDHIKHLGFYPADRRKLSMHYAAENLCPCLTSIFPKGTKHLTAFNEVDERVVRSKREIKKNPRKLMDVYPFLVSLTIPAYSDDDQQILACNGLIYSQTWILTSPHCVKNNSEWFSLTIRSGSPYWHKQGEEHLVMEYVILTKNVVALKVEPSFERKLLPFPRLKYPFIGDWVHAFSLGWDDQMYKKGIEFRYKNKIFDVEEWTSRNCSLESSSLCYENDVCSETTSKLLLTNCHHLIGMKCAGDEDNTFSGLDLLMKKVSLNAQKIYRKACFNIHEDNCPATQLETCYTNYM